MSKTKEKTLTDLQEELAAYIAQFKLGYFPPMEQLARLTEEVGELSREVCHHFGEKKKKPEEKEGSIAEELGDVLITTLLFANSLEIDLNAQFEKNMEKFQKRDKFRYERVEKHDD